MDVKRDLSLSNEAWASTDQTKGWPLHNRLVIGRMTCEYPLMKRR